MTDNSTPRIETPFINLQSDYGFKRAFGSAKYKRVVIRFLQAALGDEVTVTDVRFHDKEKLPAGSGGKRIVYDVYFTMEVPARGSTLKPFNLRRDIREDDVTHHFILEMQNLYEPPFEDRMLYYASKTVAEQGGGGWNYDLDPVVLITIIDFDFPHLTKRLAREFRIQERTTGEVLTEKLRFLFYSLKQVPGQWEDCGDDLQRQLYLIKNMDKMDKNSKPYRDGGYDELFEAAESNLLAGEEVVLYSQSLARMQAIRSGMEYRYEEGRAEGIVEGRAEGIVEGRAEGIVEGRAEEKIMIARKMISGGMAPALVASFTGLSLEKISAL